MSMGFSPVAVTELTKGAQIAATVMLSQFEVKFQAAATRFELAIIKQVAIIAKPVAATAAKSQLAISFSP